MNVWFGVLVGLLMLGSGASMYFLAPRIGPNPIFGVRTGYSFANRDVWNQSNRFGGVVFSGIGLALLVLTAFLAALGVQGEAAIWWLTGALLALILSGTAWIFVYTRRLAQATDLAQTLTPVDVPFRTVAPAVITWGLLALLSLALWPTLSPVVATHFGPDGQPNDWMTRTAFTLFYLGLSGIITLIPVGVAWVARREPIIGVSRLGSRWYIAPREGIALTAWLMAMVNLSLIPILLDTAWFDWYGVHLMNLGAMTLLMVAWLIGWTLALFAVFVRRSAASQDQAPPMQR